MIQKIFCKKLDIFVAQIGRREKLGGLYSNYSLNINVSQFSIVFKAKLRRDDTQKANYCMLFYSVYSLIPDHVLRFS